MECKHEKFYKFAHHLLKEYEYCMKCGKTKTEIDLEKKLAIVNDLVESLTVNSKCVDCDIQQQLSAANARIAELEKDRQMWINLGGKYKSKFEQQEQRAEKAEARMKRMEDALYSIRKSTERGECDSAYYEKLCKEALREE